jgi:hypothetical protein
MTLQGSGSHREGETVFLREKGDLLRFQASNVDECVNCCCRSLTGSKIHFSGALQGTSSRWGRFPASKRRAESCSLCGALDNP